MTDTAAATLRKTPLNARHRASNARMVPFAGWDMPVEYSGVTAEHMAVRTRAGVFDVSHMGEIEIAGKDALAAVQHISSNDASRLQIGQAHYSALTTPDGTFVDDMLVYRMGPSHFMLVVNASNIEKDYQWIAAQIKTAADSNAGADGQITALSRLRSVSSFALTRRNSEQQRVLSSCRTAYWRSRSDLGQRASWRASWRALDGGPGLGIEIRSG